MITMIITIMIITRIITIMTIIVMIHYSHMILWVSNIPWLTDHFINLDCTIGCLVVPSLDQPGLFRAKRSSGDLWCKCLLSSLLVLDQSFPVPVALREPAARVFR